MNQIAGLRQKRGQTQDRAKAIIDKAIAEVRPMTDEENTEFKALEKQLENWDETIQRAEKQEEEAAKTAKPLNLGPTLKEDPKREKGHALSLIVRSLAATKGNTHLAADHCERVFGDGEVAKALAAGSGAAGGFLVPDNFSSEIIEFLRPISVVRRMGARTVPLANGNLTMPKQTGGASAAYIGENTNIPVTQATFGQVKLSAKKLAALTPISNDLIRFASPAVDDLVRSDLVAAIGQAEDNYFLRSDGTGAGPKGLRYWSPTTNRLTINPTVNLDNVTKDTSRLMLRLLNANVRMVSPGWIMAPRTKMFLEDLRDGNGNKAFPELERDMFRGFPIGVSTNVPINLAVTGTDESELYFVDFADVLIGEVPGLVIDVSSEAAYHDGNNVVAAFSLDQTVIRIIMQNDLAVRHAESVALFTDVKWGA